MSIDNIINDSFAGVASAVLAVTFYSIEIPVGGDVIAVPLLLLWLMAAGLFFTVYLGFINLRYFKHSIDVLRGKYDKPGDDGQIGRFEALTTSLSGTVGLGNIAGVAVAVSVGGPGAVVWMVIMGFLGMSTKFAEIALAVKYRHHPDPKKPERISGGPMYYLRDGFANKNIPYVGNFMAWFYALCCMLGAIGAGCMFQANQSYQQVLNVTGGEASFFADKGWLFGLILAVLVGVVILGGIKSIANVASRLVPMMGLIYVLACLAVIFINWQNIPSAFGEMFVAAFTLQAGIGGLIGAVLNGIKRAFFSNEAGLGSAAIVHSTARTDDHISQGFVGMLGPFVDTIIICLLTGLVITISGVYSEGAGMEGIALTSRAFESVISWFPYVLVLVVLLFAYSTLITWSYYGTKCIGYMFKENELAQTTFKVLFCLFAVVGCSANLSHVLDFTDGLFLFIGVPNIIGLYFLAPELKRDLKVYLEKISK